MRAMGGRHAVRFGDVRQLDDAQPKLDMQWKRDMHRNDANFLHTLSVQDECVRHHLRHGSGLLDGQLLRNDVVRAEEGRWCFVSG
jgi:hypothetical protein